MICALILGVTSVSASAYSRPDTRDTFVDARSPGSSPCSARRCRRSGPAWCCCTSSTPDSAGYPGRDGSTRVTLPPAADHRLLHGRLTAARRHQHVLGRGAPSDPAGDRCSAGAWSASSPGSCAPACSTSSRWNTCASPRAMGLRERTVVNQHALRNALLPTITIVGFTFAFLITGAVLDRDRLLLAGCRQLRRRGARASSTTRRSSASPSSAASRSWSPTSSPTSPTRSPTRGSRLS